LFVFNFCRIILLRGKSALKIVDRFIARIIRWVDDPKRLQWFGEPIFRMTGFRKHKSRPRKPVNVAVIKLDRLGDVVLCSQLLAGLRRAWPKTRITLFVREGLVDLARLCPDVDEIIGVPVEEGNMMADFHSGKYSFWKERLPKWLQCCHHGRLWKKRFDMVLVPRWEADYYGAISLAYLTGASQRWGVTETATSEKAIINRGFDQLLTHVIEGQCMRHEFLLNESFLRALDIQTPDNQKLACWVTEADRKKAADFMTSAGVVTSKKTIVLCMGAGLARKMWPVESYAELCRMVFNFKTVQLVTNGTVAEKALGLQLKEMLGDVVINLEGKMPLNILPAAVSLGTLYIGSDTGTKHLAVAAGLPVFEISCHPLIGEPYWVESPLRFGPWSVPYRVVQPEKATAPCEKYCFSIMSHCILGISMEQATSALRLLLEETGLQSVCKSGTINLADRSK
jgi:heptosyltransferase-2